MYNEEIVNKTKRYLKRYKNILEISMINYEGLNYYIRLDKHPKKEIYYLRSVNLNILDKFDKTIINQEVLTNQPVEIIYDILSKVTIKELDNHTSPDTDLIRFKANYDNSEYKYTFNLFIPQNTTFIADIMYIIFTNLPKRMFSLFDELTASLTHNEIKYTYTKPFKFDLFKGDLTKVFTDKVIVEGKKYYDEKRVRFIEKINNSYYATIDGNNKKLYTVILDYDPKTKTVRTGCNCPCEFFCKHMYATILSIRNKETFKYYKVRYIDEDAYTMYDKLFTLNYFLCIGIEDDKLILVYPNGQIQSVFIFDSEGAPMFEVVEDDQDNSLTKYIKEYKKS